MTTNKKFFGLIFFLVLLCFTLYVLINFQIVKFSTELNIFHKLNNLVINNKLFWEIIHVLLVVIDCFSALILIGSVLLQRGEEGAFAKASNAGQTKTDSNSLWSVTVISMSVMSVCTMILSLVTFIIYKMPFAG